MERVKKLSETIVNHSLQVKKGDKVLITYQSNECNYFIRRNDTR